MDIRCRKGLEEAMVLKLRELEASCRDRDGEIRPISLDSWMNFSPEMKSCFLLYAGERLVSFLHVFAPEAKEAEVQAVTHPGFRRRGCFSALLREAAAELKRFGVNRILLVHDKKNRDGAETVRRLGARLHRSEYSFRYEGVPACTLPRRIRLERAGIQDLVELSALDVRIFGSDPEVSRSMIRKTLDDPANTTYTAFLEKERIGVCSAGFREEIISVFGLGIAPDYQGRGYGKEMLCLLLNKLKEYPGRTIALEAGSDNQAALGLYRGSGFVETARIDYYAYEADGSIES